MFKTIEECLEVYKKQVKEYYLWKKKKIEAMKKSRPSFNQDMEEFCRGGNKRDTMIIEYMNASFEIWRVLTRVENVLGLTPKEAQKIKKEIKEKIDKEA